MNHFHISRKTFEKIIATTQKGGANEGKVGSDTRVNPHSGKKFIVYHLYDMQQLLKAVKK